MTKENISQESRLENIDETRNYFLEEVKQNELMSKKDKKVCTTLNDIGHFLILAFTITGCILISAFASLIAIPIPPLIAIEFCNRIKNLCNNCRN